MPTSLVNLSTTEYVKVNSQLNGIVLQSLRDRVRLSFSVAKPSVTNTVYHVLSGADDPLSIRNMDTDLWALATSDNCSLVATEFENTEGTIEVTIDDVGVKDSGDTRIDPATKQNQEAVIVTEDEPSVDGQKGIPAMGVTNEAQADLVDTDGDENRFATDKRGTQYVRDEALSSKVGEVDPNPTSNTVLWRLKELKAAIEASAGALTETELRTVLPDETGTWGYNSGTSGTLNVAANKRVMQISATAGLIAATMTINGGSTVTIPAGRSLTIEPRANLIAPTIVFTGTTAYFVEHVE